MSRGLIDHRRHHHCQHHRHRHHRHHRHYRRRVGQKERQKLQDNKMYCPHQGDIVLSKTWTNAHSNCDGDRRQLRV